ncbi:MAG: glycosyltransferase family 4 protein [Allosphingosinicella sp.]
MTGERSGAGRTCIVLGSYAPSLIHFRGSLIAELVRRGYKVVAMAPEIGADVRGQLAALGAEAAEVPLTRDSLSPAAMAGSLRALTRAFREIRPDAVIAYTVKPVTLGAIAARKAGVPTFVALVTGLGFAFVEGRETKRRISRIAATWLYRAAFRLSRIAIFQNPDDRDFFRARRILPRGAKTALVNGSGVDIDAFAPAPLTEEPTFLMIARLLGDKGVREYGRAAARLKAKYPHAQFRLVGWLDPSPDSIGQAALDEMVAGGVDFLGKLDDVRPAIAAANVYVLPSYREGTPRSVLEAMAMGRPVVTTDAPGCRQTVEHGRNGLLVPPRDDRALEAAMEHFIRTPGAIAAMGAESRALAEERFDVRKVNAALLEAAGL